MKYLSNEWVAEQYRAAEEAGHYDPSDAGTDCGGWSFSGPPCGGCDRCVGQQLAYYIDKERERAAVFLRAGLGVSDPSLVVLGWHPGFGGYHDAYNCWMAKEISECAYAWIDYGAKTETEGGK